jgi:hypothetical protein
MYLGPYADEISVFNTDEVSVGTLIFQVKYNAGQLYMGEKFGNYETMPIKEPVKLYSGACETRNLFNYFDSGYEGKPCNTYEPAYRDETWGDS